MNNKIILMIYAVICFAIGSFCQTNMFGTLNPVTQGIIHLFIVVGIMFGAFMIDEFRIEKDE